MKCYFKPDLKKRRTFSRLPSSSSQRKRRSIVITGLDEVLTEIELMKKLDNSNTIRLIEVINDPTADKLYIIMSLAENGDLMEFNSST